MLTFRIARKKWVGTLTGSGVPGRWNRSGERIIYTSSSLALALLEILVHIQPDQIPDDYWYVIAEFSEDLVEILDIVPEDTQMAGSKWLSDRGRSAILQVPSVIVPENNFLLNPEHTDFSQIRWSEPTPLQIDPRLTRGFIRRFRGTQI